LTRKETIQVKDRYGERERYLTRIGWGEGVKRIEERSRDEEYGIINREREIQSRRG